MKLQTRYFFYTTIFLLLAFLGIAALQFVFWVVETYLKTTLPDWKWLTFGLFLGVAFSFLVAITPKVGCTNPDEELKKSFHHYLLYFLYFIIRKPTTTKKIIALNVSKLIYSFNVK